MEPIIDGETMYIHYNKHYLSYLDNKTMAAKEFYDKVKSKSVHLGDKTVNNFKRLFQCMEVI